VATDRLTSVIDTLLTVARGSVATGKTVRVAEVLAAATAPGAIGAPNAVIAVDHVPDLRIAAPREVALRALSPLVDNAVRYAHVRVRLGAKAEGGMVAIYVEDDGHGVPDEDREAVFEPGHLSPDSDGAGLGLPLARRVARASGGDVRRDDTHPARFVLTLPAEP
jgi:signal transduction histidine kinase